MINMGNVQFQLPNPHYLRKKMQKHNAIDAAAHGHNNWLALRRRWRKQAMALLSLDEQLDQRILCGGRLSG
ncbi:MAG: hypothetical protein BroJett021_25020 [Chloroflexota bacterium]|nr:MAG: hypothetical protein BroJett021_25020 [Chloroflexota bacterium]